MIHYYNYRPETDPTAVSEQTINKRPRGHHLLRGLFKFLAWFILIVSISTLLLSGFLYFFIANTGVSNTNARTNILVTGVDEVALLSDTIMIASILHGSGDSPPEVALISIPRDLIVDIPSFGPSKINAAYAFGERNNYPGGGVGLTAQTIQTEFGLDIHYYMSVDFVGFEAVIDSVGGVEIDVQTDINDPYYPAEGYRGFEPFAINKGTQTLDGATALKYARSRQTTNDFDRSFRQQQIAVALKDEVYNPKDLSGYMRIINLIKTLDDQIQTDISRLEMLKLGYMLRGLDTENVNQYVLDTTNLLVGTPTRFGSSLLPRAGDFSEIKTFLDEIFTQDFVDEFEQQQF